MKQNTPKSEYQRQRRKNAGLHVLGVEVEEELFQWLKGFAHREGIPVSHAVIGALWLLREQPGNDPTEDL